MDSKEAIGIIELGNLNLKCLIYKINNNNNNTEILSATTTPSEGIHNDVVMNLKKASDSIRLSISTAEKKAKISLKKIHVILEHPDFLCTRFSKKMFRYLSDHVRFAPINTFGFKDSLFAVF